MKTVTHLAATDLGCIRQGKVLFPPVSFSLCAGRLLLVEGANGAGKSSLLRLIAAAATPAHGTLSWNGKSLEESHAEYIEHIHYVGHANGIRLGLTVAENLLLAGELAQHPVTDMESTLALLQLNEQQHTQTQFLSAGQKRRAALARLFLIPRSLWILDEPFTSLDVATQKMLLDKIEGHLANGGMCVMTSHHPVALKHPALQVRLVAC